MACFDKRDCPAVRLQRIKYQLLEDIKVYDVPLGGGNGTTSNYGGDVREEIKYYDTIFFARTRTGKVCTHQAHAQE